MSDYRNKHDHDEIIEAWQNKKGNVPPDWIQGRGTGGNGSPMILWTGEFIVTVKSDEWISREGNGIGTIFTPYFFEANYEKIPEWGNNINGKVVGIETY